MVGNIANQKPNQCSYTNVEQKAKRHMISFEIDSRHCEQFEINEKQQNIIHRDFCLPNHFSNRAYPCINGYRADGKKGKIVK